MTVQGSATPLRRALRSGTAAAALTAAGIAVTIGDPAPTQAADGFNESAFPGNVTWTMDGNPDDTWDIDKNVGDSAADITVNGTDGGGTLTIDESSGDGTTHASVGSLIYPDNKDGGADHTAKVTVGDGKVSFFLTVHGDVDLATDDADAPTLRLVGDDGTAGAGSGPTLRVHGDIDMGRGRIVLDADPDEVADATVLELSGTADQTVTGRIDGPAHLGGDIIVDKTDGKAFFKDAVGGTNALYRITIQDGTAVFRDDVATEDGIITWTSARVEFRKKGAQTVTGPIDADFPGHGTVLVGSASTTTFKGPIGSDTRIDTFKVEHGGTARLRDNLRADTVTIDGALTVAKAVTVTGNTTLDIGRNRDATVNAANRLRFGSNATLAPNGNTVSLKVRAGSGFDPTSTEVLDDNGNTVTVANNGTLKVGFHRESRPVADGAEMVITDANMVKNGAIEVVDTAMVDLTDTSNGANDLAVTVNYRTTPRGATGNAAAALGPALDATFGGNDPAFGAIANLEADETQGAGEQLAGGATVGNGVSRAVASTGNQNMSIAAGRLASLRSGERYASRGQTGLAAGDGGLSRAVWMKPYAKTGDRDERDGVAGYDSDTYGIMGGVDAAVGDGFRVGGAFGYAGTDVDGEGAAQSTQDVDSYQVTAYGDYTADTWFVEGMAAYGYNSVDTTSRITFGGLNRTRRGDYTAHQYSARVRGGLPFALGGGQTLTPSAGFQVTHIDNESYTTTGAGSLDQRVDPADVDKAIAMAGVTYAADMATDNGTLTPEVRARALYDFAADQPEQTRTYTGGGASFSTTGADVAELGGKLGAGLTYATADGRWTLSADYDMEVKEDFLGHTGQLEARYHF